MPSLMDMPEIVMNKILEVSDVREIQTLRKVCHDLRNYIDDTQLDSNLRTIFINVSLGKIRISYDGQKQNDVEYRKNQLGCSLVNLKKEKLLKNENFRKVAIQDLELVLKNQKSELHSLSILNGRNAECRENTWLPFLKDVGNILKTRPYPLKTNHFDIDPIDQQEVLWILPFIDSNFLDEITFYKCYPDEGPPNVLEIDEISKLEQWKKTKSVESMLYISFGNFMDDYGHFESIRIKLKTVSTEELLILKTTFISSPSLQEMTIRCDELYSDGQLPYGPPILDEDPRYEREFWYFRIPNSDLIVKISRRSGCAAFIYFDKIERENVLKNAIIQM